MHSKSDTIEVITHDNLDETIAELLESLLSRYQISLENQFTETIYFIANVIK